MSTPKSLSSLARSCALSSIIFINLIFSGIFVYAVTLQIIQPKEKMIEAASKKQPESTKTVLTIAQIQ
jgi:cell division protein FtsI/penicillin-binding protein 2